ncbi:HAD-like domain-containing protein [Halteromyces radiatus]|uniref:HAD-like domain-containing protein n=1 Tax=Halteromyces radiatus TaxID=101107 RepID=UPI00222036B1|nr:HAD-like domain-containing protein [Halteromyces radiatus]KAI8097266.1 HAD-like domain-containing protein [Halteromyces radiatus]
MFSRSFYNTIHSFHRSIRFLTTSSIAKKPNYAFAFDIDGVLLKGKKPIAEAKSAIQLLNGDNPQNRRVPFVLLTNGGGMTEAAKANQVSNLIDVEISPDQVILSHSPMQMLTKKYKEKRVLVVGGKGKICADLAKGYGFDNVVTPQDLHHWNNSLWPYSQPKDITEAAYQDYSTLPIEAVMMFHDSFDWGRDLQVMLDALCSHDGIIGTMKKDFSTQSMPVYFSNNDLIWSTDFPTPRLGQGAFKEALEGLYKALTGGSLISESFGKPHGATYFYAERVISRHHQTLYGEPFVPEHVYAIGDNPAADIKGANAHGWSSLLVRTGVHTGPGNSQEYPADVVCDNVLDAVRWAINKEEIVVAKFYLIIQC